MLKLLALKEAYINNEEGATAIEYGLIAAGIAVAIAAVVGFVGDELLIMFTGVQTELATANA
ncbi:MAG: Flp family type IVb pilin [Alphaproteobacteria bacterium]|nr:Flp family type IVb pilin [Alphaproteobacteria bacterium]